MTKKKAQYVLELQTITRLRIMAAETGIYQSVIVARLIDEEWERRESAKSNISQKQEG